MKYMSLAATALALMTFSPAASAADLPARTYTKAPPIADPGYDWTGFYAGLNGGYSLGRANSTVLATPLRVDLNGGLGGGQAGYNWQVNRSWVLGLEGDIQWTGERASTSATLVGPRFPSTALGVPFPGPGPDFNAITTATANLSYDLQWFATFRGRAGFLADPQTLLYGTGGLAVGEFKHSAQTTSSTQVFFPGAAGTTPLGAPIVVAGAAASSSDIRVGWTVGAGVERKFSANWSGKLEYLYLDFGSKTFFAGTVNQADVSFHDHVFRAGINYAFNPTPVVARY
jgi:outer membrane immunogenic protein